MDYSKALFIKEHRNAAENLSEGQIFSAFDFPVTYTYNFGNEVRSSSPAYMVYLGEDPSHLLWNHVRFLVVLKNGTQYVKIIILPKNIQFLSLKLIIPEIILILL
jgi:hypothetical protein